MITKVSNGWKHTGSGYRPDPVTDEYPVQPLPRWSVFTTYARNKRGTYNDINHYMEFSLHSGQTAYLKNLTGNDIANTICGLYDTTPAEELKKLNTEFNLNFKNWDDMYYVLKRHYEIECD